jgi:hypothetical protein
VPHGRSKAITTTEVLQFAATGVAILLLMAILVFAVLAWRNSKKSREKLEALPNLTLLAENVEYLIKQIDGDRDGWLAKSVGAIFAQIGNAARVRDEALIAMLRNMGLLLPARLAIEEPVTPGPHDFSAARGGPFLPAFDEPVGNGHGAGRHVVSLTGQGPAGTVATLPVVAPMLPPPNVPVSPAPTGATNGGYPTTVVVTATGEATVVEPGAGSSLDGGHPVTTEPGDPPLFEELMAAAITRNSGEQPLVHAPEAPVAD